ncbi:DUF2141 domain-containing protein [Bacteroides heparinolyticus]|uniref:DUF2141 domain-containing protein n=1 Tax=Prevotella heparinolytica TaxID=28113 RepID=UPI0023F0D02E|nr:DUF2141 domain-containing protein [Bacteroides heparinolyticus]
MKAMIVFLVCLFQGTVTLLFAQNLTIEVRDIEKAEGHLYVAIYNSEEAFMKKPIATFRVDVKDKILSIPCRGLPVGTYAVSLFQDENGNGSLDTGAYGIPTEKYGFSNDAEGVMGPPSYDKCSFIFSADMTLVIHLR